MGGMAGDDAAVPRRATPRPARLAFSWRAETAEWARNGRVAFLHGHVSLLRNRLCVVEA